MHWRGSSVVFGMVHVELILGILMDAPSIRFPSERPTELDYSVGRKKGLLGSDCKSCLSGGREKRKIAEKQADIICSHIVSLGSLS